MTSSVVIPRPNPLFDNVPKDVWSMINEAAALAEKESGKKITNLGQGFFSYSPPDFAIEAAKRALDVPMLNQYSPTRGRQSLRNALAKSYSPFFNKAINPDTEIVVTSGANEGMLSAFMAFVHPGDEVIVFEPFFDQYISNIQMPGGKVVYVPLHPPADAAFKTSSAANWSLDVKELENAITAKTKMIVINTPQNPTGKIFSKQELQIIADLAVKHNVIVLSDEVYDSLFYTPFTRIATLNEDIAKLTISVGSAGKTFAATGWRVGWLIANAELITPIAAANTRICFTANSPLQEACAEAIELAAHNDYYETQIKSFKNKFEILNSVWDELGLPYSIPEGGYFVLVHFGKVKIPEDYEFPKELLSKPKDFRVAYWLIREIGVVSIPPTEFYIPEHAHYAEDFLRFAVCKDDAILEDAVERLRGLKKYIQ
ncbi:PLP-dependent transferase [Nadsonia fulvescens var. elongata DSM 6958]|uniref:PLP-dependent transferase n=1 Tax=Nadsonia fulvescens var. elongata DSM 6958 TaxID=857566 RepID=A0A1E3PUS4_9ASCO|nr:PLP-dependent transferase [Nadsonia fulvescens var. elongata DSM 6958]